MSAGTFEVKIGKEVYEVDAKDENEAWQLANKFHVQNPVETKETVPPKSMLQNI